MPLITESHIESFAIETLRSLGWSHVYGATIAPSGEEEERKNFEQVVLVDRLRKAVDILNPDIPPTAREQAIQKALKIYAPDLLSRNEFFHQMLIEKIKVPYQQDGFERSHEVALINDFKDSLNNEFLAVSQSYCRRERPKQKAGYHPVRQWTATGRYRIKKCVQRDRHTSESLRSAPNL